MYFSMGVFCFTKGAIVPVVNMLGEALPAIQAIISH